MIKPVRQTSSWVIREEMYSLIIVSICLPVPMRPLVGPYRATPVPQRYISLFFRWLQIRADTGGDATSHIRYTWSGRRNGRSRYIRGLQSESSVISAVSDMRKLVDQPGLIGVASER